MAKKVKMLKGVKLNTKGLLRERLICSALEGILANESLTNTRNPDEVALLVFDHVVAVEKVIENEKTVNRAKKAAEKEQKAKEKAEKKEAKRIQREFKKASRPSDNDTPSFGGSSGHSSGRFA